MNTKIDLQISNPCTQQFNQFKKTTAGGYCAACQKEVVDFTNMTPKEIMNFFTNKEESICGSFKTSQLKTYTSNSMPRARRFSFLGGLSFLVLALGTVGATFAQTQKQPTVIVKKDSAQTIQGKVYAQKAHTISGIVSDTFGPLPGASILLQGTVIGTETDFDGKFVFPKKLKKGDVLLISFIGYETKKIVISGDQKNLQLAMKIKMIASSCNILGEVEVKKVYKSKKSLWRKLKS